MWKHKANLTYEKSAMSIWPLNDTVVTFSPTWLLACLTPLFTRRLRELWHLTKYKQATSFTCKVLLPTQLHLKVRDVKIAYDWPRYCTFMPTWSFSSWVVTYTQQLQWQKTAYSYRPRFVDWCLEYRKVQTNGKRAILLLANFSGTKTPFVVLWCYDQC